jgi:polyhydroxybutyrate depolymerase
MITVNERFLTLTVDGRSRRALIRWPTTPGPWPLLLALHGTGSTAVWMAQETGLGDLADTEGWLVAFPEGTLPHPDQPHRLRSNPLRWNDGSPVLPGDATANVDDVRFLTELIGQLTTELPVDLTRVVMTGFSNGAGMAFRWADAEADRLSALVPIAGLSWVNEPRVQRAVPTLYMIGDADPLIPLQGGPVRLPWGLTVHKPPVLASLAPWERAIGREAMTTLILPGHGHHWPGGRAGLNPRLFGPNNPTMAANPAIVAFARRHFAAMTESVSSTSERSQSSTS